MNEQPASGSAMPPEPASPPTEPVATPAPEAAPPPAPMPVSQPAMQPQPAVSWQPAPAAAVAVGARPRSTLAAAAGITMIVLAVLGFLFAALLFFGSAVLGGLGTAIGPVPGLPAGTDVGDVVGGVVAVFGVIVAAYSLVYLFGGIGVLRSRDWGRVMGIIVAVLSGLFWLASLGGSGTGESGQSGLVFVVIMLALHVYIFFALAFRWRAAPA